MTAAARTPAAHDVADDEGGAAGAEGDDVVPVAADGRVGAAGLVGGGDAQVVGLLQLLREQGALEGDGGLALAALAGAQALGGFGVVGDVGGEDEDAAAALSPASRRRTATGVQVTVYEPPPAGLAGLDRTGLAAAQDLVQEREQASSASSGRASAAGSPAGRGPKAGGVGVVDVGDAVVGAVHEGDEGREAAEDLAGGEVVEGGPGGGRGGRRCRGVAGRGRPAGGRGLRLGVLGAGPRGRGVRSSRAAARRCVPGSRALQRVKFTEFWPRVSVRCVAAGHCLVTAGRVTLCRCGPTYGHTSSVDRRQSPSGHPGSVRTAHRERPVSVRRRPRPAGSGLRVGTAVRFGAAGLATGREFELRPGVFERAEGDDLPFEESGEGPFGEDARLAVEGGHPAEVVRAVHEPGRVALELAAVDVGDALVQAEGGDGARVLVARTP